MKRMWQSILLCLVAMTLLSCMTPKERFLKNGARLLSTQEIAQSYSGNTLKAATWSAYYREDGARLVYVPSQAETHRLRWWIDSNSRWCESSTSGQTNCNLEVYRRGEQYKVFAGSKVYSFKILQGNPLKISDQKP